MSKPKRGTPEWIAVRQQAADELRDWGDEQPEPPSVATLTVYMVIIGVTGRQSPPCDLTVTDSDGFETTITISSPYANVVPREDGFIPAQTEWLDTVLNTVLGFRRVAEWKAGEDFEDAPEGSGRRRSNPRLTSTVDVRRIAELERAPGRGFKRVESPE